jgi:hypothetical protein
MEIDIMATDSCDGAHSRLNYLGIKTIHAIGTAKNIFDPKPITQPYDGSQITRIGNIVQYK